MLNHVYFSEESLKKFASAIAESQPEFSEGETQSHDFSDCVKAKGGKPAFVKAKKGAPVGSDLGEMGEFETHRGGLSKESVAFLKANAQIKA